MSPLPDSQLTENTPDWVVDLAGDVLRSMPIGDWHITLSMFDFEDQKWATVDFDAPYRQATIVLNKSLINAYENAKNAKQRKNARRDVRTALIHECWHIVLAHLHDFELSLMAALPSDAQATLKHIQRHYHEMLVVDLERWFVVRFK